MIFGDLLGSFLDEQSNLELGFEHWKSKLIEMKQLGYSAYGISEKTEIMLWNCQEVFAAARTRNLGMKMSRH